MHFITRLSVFWALFFLEGERTIFLVFSNFHQALGNEGGDLYKKSGMWTAHRKWHEHMHYIFCDIFFLLFSFSWNATEPIEK